MLALTALLVGIASCARDPSADDGKTHISFWATPKDDPNGSLRQIIDAFEAKYPQYAIDYTQQGGYDNLYTAVKQALPAGNQPVISYAYPDHVATYLSANAVRNMDGYIDDASIGLGRDDDLKGVKVGDATVDLHTAKEDIVSAYLEEGQHYAVAGTYSLPFSKSSEVLFYDYTLINRITGYDEATILDKLSTWEKLWAFNRELLSKDAALAERALQRAGGAFAYDSDDNFYITASRQLGIPYTKAPANDSENPFLFVDKNAEQTGYVANPKAKKLIETLYGNYFENLLITTETNSGQPYNSNYMVGTGPEGHQQLAVDVSSTAGTRYFAPGASGVGETVYKAAPYPKSETDWTQGGTTPLSGDAKGDAVISQGPSITFFQGSKISEEQTRGAWLFYKFATSDYMTAFFASKEGYEPVRTSSYSLAPMTQGVAPLFQSVHDIVKGYGDQGRLFFSPVFQGSAESRKAVGAIFAGVAKSSQSRMDAAALDAAIEKQFATAKTASDNGLPQ